MKLPAIMFYPGDWLRDPVAGCSLAAQGLWFRMMILMHDSEPYGYLVMNGSPIPPESIARRCGCTPEQYETLLAELERAGVPSRTSQGIIFSRRMARDARARANAAKRQRRSRSSKNDETVVSRDCHTFVEDEDEKEKSPGSKPLNQLPDPDWLPKGAWNAWEEMRLARGKPLTPRARVIAIRKLDELRATGHDPQAILEEATLKQWFDLSPSTYGADVGGKGGLTRAQQRTRNNIKAAGLVQ
jgi:hypothetical protein